MAKFVPYLYIGIGETGAFYTLRETYLHTVYTYNGKYTEVRSFHHFNLGQDADEALKKARAHAEQMGLELRADYDDMRCQMREIKRASAEELERRERERQERQALWEKERQERHEERLALISQGVMPFGRYSGTRFEDLPVRYVNWIVQSKETFEPDSYMALVAQEVIKNHSHLVLPTPDPCLHIGTVGERRDFEAIVLNSFELVGAYGYLFIVSLYDVETGAQLVVKSGTVGWMQPGARIRFKASIKDHTYYRDSAQTVLTRVKKFETTD